MPEKAASTLPGNARPLVHSDRGRHYRWPGWLALMERFGLTRSMSAKGCSPDNACVCSIESGPCERVESLQMSGRF